MSVQRDLCAGEVGTTLTRRRTAGLAAGSDGAALSNVINTAIKSAVGGRGNYKAQMAATQLRVEQMFGGLVPTLHSIVSKAKLLFVRFGTTIRETPNN